MAGKSQPPDRGHSTGLPVKDDWGEDYLYDPTHGAEDAEAEPEPDEGAVPETGGAGELSDDALGKGGSGVVLRYAGGDRLDGLPTRDELVAECDTGGYGGLLSRHICEKRPVYFMPTDVEETVEYDGGREAYALRLYGALLNGAKAEVTVHGIEVFFDVRAPDPARLGELDLRLRAVLTGVDVWPTCIDTVEAFPIRGYHPAPVPYKRVRLPTLKARKKALEAVREAGFETASDDLRSYYRKAAREHGLPLSDWAVLGAYEHTAGPTERSPLCAHLFRVPASAYRPLVGTMAPKAEREKSARTRDAVPLLARDRTLVVGWDIETYSDRKVGGLPTAANAGDCVFMICVTAHWKDEPAPLRRVCLVAAEAAPDPRWTTVVCSGQAALLKAFALTWRGLAPDVAAGFNDSDYDWPFVVDKAEKLGVLGWMVATMSASPRRTTTAETARRWNYRRDQKIKIAPDVAPFYSSYLKVPGCVPVDVRVCYKKLYPKNGPPKAGSLRYYLALVGLPGKADMPHTRMWRHYEASREGRPGAAEHMRQVAHYCVVDALSCQRLLVRRNVINDCREVSTLAFVSLFDAHYYADGMKVCNLLAAYAWRRKILVSMIPAENAEDGKYPGAYVFPPKKGLIPDPDRLAAVDRAAAGVRGALAAAGLADERAETALREGLATAAGAPGGNQLACACAALALALAAFAGDRPVTGLDFQSLYPSLIMTYNLSPEKILLTAEEAAHWKGRGLTLHPIEFTFNGRPVRAWSVRHNNAEQDIGLFATVLIDLFNKRAEMKVPLAAYGATKELIDLVNGRAEKDGVATAEAARRVLAEAEGARASTGAYLGPGAPPPRVSPGSTPAEELADLKRRHGLAAGQTEGVRRLFGLAGLDPSDAAVEAAIKAEYDRVSFDWSCLNSKQYALKVYMNRFYGELGNKLGPLFLLELAGAVTGSGQYNIKLAADIVRERGFRTVYGDTDSMYLICPPALFVECDVAYALGRLTREEWWSAMVRITMRALNTIRDEVSARLKANNGSAYLRMAYEEVLYPVSFTGKKKYFGTPHLNEVNFRPKKLFTKGLDFLKQGQSGLARTIGDRVLWASTAVDNSRGQRRIVEDVLRDAVLNRAQWAPADFELTAAWRPDKDNKAVVRFMARMSALHALEVAEREQAAAAAPGAPLRPYRYELPDPGERFSYVLVVPRAAYDLRGCKIDLKGGDLMEFPHAARELGLEIDVAAYMVKHVVGMCARFINGDPAFQPPRSPFDQGFSEEELEKRADVYAQKAAKKALTAFVKGLDQAGAEEAHKRGVAYRRAYSQAVPEARSALVERVGAGAAEVLHGSWLDFELFLRDGGKDAPDAPSPINPVSATVDALWSRAGVLAGEIVEGEGDARNEALARALGIGPDGHDLGPGGCVQGSGGSTARLFALSGAPRGTRGARRTAGAGLHGAEAEARTAIATLIPEARAIAARYEADLARLVHRLRPQATGAAPLALAGEEQEPGLCGVAGADAAPLLALRRAWLRAAGIELVRRRDASFASYLSRLRDRRLGHSAAPSRSEREGLVAAAAASLHSDQRPPGR
jgi:DNA polymerase elongation subunit (family B)